MELLNFNLYFISKKSCPISIVYFMDIQYTTNQVERVLCIAGVIAVSLLLFLSLSCFLKLLSSLSFLSNAYHFLPALALLMDNMSLFQEETTCVADEGNVYQVQNISEIFKKQKEKNVTNIVLVFHYK